MTHIRMIAAENCLRVMRFWFFSSDPYARSHINYLQECLLRHLYTMIAEDAHARRGKRTDEMHEISHIADTIAASRVADDSDIDGIARWLKLHIPSHRILVPNPTRRFFAPVVIDGMTGRSLTSGLAQL